MKLASSWKNWRVHNREAFGFVQEIEDELQSGVVHLAGRAQVQDAAELPQAFDIK